jgi:hypothetical protein
MDRIISAYVWHNEAVKIIVVALKGLVKTTHRIGAYVGWKMEVSLGRLIVFPQNPYWQHVGCIDEFLRHTATEETNNLFASLFLPFLGILMSTIS